MSSVFSWMSCTSWIFAQFPQILKNYTSKSAEGISPSFLALWFLGDFLSFTSCLMNEDVVLGFQIYLSIFFLCNDVTLCFQYYYYNSVYPTKHGFQYTPVLDTELAETTNIDVHQSSAIHIRNTKMAMEYVENSAGSSYNSTNNSPVGSSPNGITPNRNSPNSQARGQSSSQNWGSPSLITASAAAAVFNAATTNALPIYSTALPVIDKRWGLITAWCCTVVYVSSRTPQLYKNYKRKSVDGISPLLFGAALLGNLGYTLSILTSCEFLFGPDKKEFFLRELPYIIGSSGTIVFDALYFYQKHLYRDPRKNTLAIRMRNWDREDSNPRIGEELDERRDSNEGSQLI